MRPIVPTPGLTNEDLHALDDFLASPGMEDVSMDVSAMQGFFVALALGPNVVMPSDWMPWIWDMHEGEAAPDFEDRSQAAHSVDLIMRHYNSVLRQLESGPASFEPIYQFGAQWGAAEWCEGFLLGMRFDEDAWTELMDSHPDWFTPFTRLGTDEGNEQLLEDNDAEHWIGEVVPSIARIYTHWAGARGNQPGEPSGGAGLVAGGSVEPAVRSGPKVGRNDPCPCGSGKKYKKCCATG